MTLIETGDNTGVFVGTFSVPDYKGSDMELVYYDAKDAGGSAVEYYDTATVVSTTLVLYHLIDQYTQYHGVVVMALLQICTMVQEQQVVTLNLVP